MSTSLYPIPLCYNPKPQQPLFLTTCVHSGIHPRFSAEIWIPNTVFEYISGSTDIYRNISDQFQCDIHFCNTVSGECQLTMLVASCPFSLASAISFLCQQSLESPSPADNGYGAAFRQDSAAQMPQMPEPREVPVAARNNCSHDKEFHRSMVPQQTFTIESHNRGQKLDDEHQNANCSPESSSENNVSHSSKRSTSKMNPSPPCQCFKSEHHAIVDQSQNNVETSMKSTNEIETKSKECNSVHIPDTTESQEQPNNQFSEDDLRKGTENVVTPSESGPSTRNNILQGKIETDEEEHTHPSSKRSTNVKHEENESTLAKTPAKTASPLVETDETSPKQNSGNSKQSEHSSSSSISDRAYDSKPWLNALINGTNARKKNDSKSQRETVDSAVPSNASVPVEKEAFQKAAPKQCEQFKKKSFTLRSPLAQYILSTKKGMSVFDTLRESSGASIYLQSTCNVKQIAQSIVVQGTEKQVSWVESAFNAIDHFLMKSYEKKSVIETDASLLVFWIPERNVGRFIGAKGLKIKKMKENLKVGLGVLTICRSYESIDYKAVVMIGKSSNLGPAFEALTKLNLGIRAKLI